jgi:hypothetical protein
MQHKYDDGEMYTEFCSINLKMRYHVGMTGTVGRTALICFVEEDSVNMRIISRESKDCYEPL